MERLIVLDTETTGIRPDEGHRIIEVGAVQILNREITSTEFHKYIQPNRTVGDSINIHGITNQFLSLLEKQIYKDPSQYFWTHNRFKHLLT